jgi:hypothetical protein
MFTSISPLRKVLKVFDMHLATWQNRNAWQPEKPRKPPVDLTAEPYTEATFANPF